MFLVKVFLIITVLVVGVYFVFKINTKNNLKDKLGALNNNWIELLKLQDEKNNLLEILIDTSLQNIQYIDSLNINLTEYTKKKDHINECSPDFVYNQYLSNKYMLPLIKFYSENIQSVDAEKKKALKAIQDKIRQINKAIEKYNSNTRNYNLYYASFPNFIIAKSYGFERKDYFEIQFGVENVDPKTLKKERREWQRKIEMEHGLSE